MSTPVSLVPYTIFRNTGTVTMFYDFIGQNGCTLNPGQDTKVPGDPWSRHARNQRKIDSMNYALENGLITIMQTPGTLRYDTAAGDVKNVIVSGNSVVQANPDYGSYYGIAPAPS